MVWEIVFMLLILKIPIVYLCVVVWWAIKAEPLPPDLAEAAVLSDTPPPGGSPRRQRTDRRRPVRPHAPGRGNGASALPQRGRVRG
jgi:hypothetical protein